MASYDIGPRLGIEGESEFRKSLLNVNEQIKTLGTEMAATTAAFSENEKSQKSLKAQSEILKKEVEAQKEKVSMLADAVAKSTEEYGENDTKTLKWKQALNNATEQLENTEQQLKKTNEELKTHKAELEKAASAWKSTGEKISGAGKTLSVASAAVTGLAVSAVKTTADFDAAMSKVAAISGATGDELDALRDKAREMGEKTKFSATESAEAMNYMAMAGWKSADMLNGIEGIMNLAAASGEDLATTSDIVTDALTAFGLTAQDSGHFADILAAAAANANTNVAMMGETFKYAAPVAGALSFSAEDTALAIGLMANAGIKASQAGTSLRGIFSRLASPTKESGTAMDSLGISLVDTSGNVKDLGTLLDELREAFGGLSEAEAAQYASMLAGKNAMSGLLAIVNASDEDFTKLSGAIDSCSETFVKTADGAVIPMSEAVASGTDTIEEYNGAAEQMAATMQDNLSGQLTILKSQTEELQISFGELLIPTIRDVVGHTQAFVDKLNELDEEDQKTIITIGLVVAAIGPALILIGKVITAVGTIIGVLPKLKAGISAVNLVMSANPIGAVIVLIGALVAAFVALWNNCEEFRNFFINLWETVSGAVSDAVDAVKEFLGNLGDNFLEKVDAAKTWGKDLINKFIEGITEKWNNLKEKVTKVADGIKDLLGFSEPKEGPLSDFHTYAPDMMKLYAQGIRDNTWRVTDQLSRSLSGVSDIAAGVADVRGGGSVGRGVVSLDSGSVAALSRNGGGNTTVKIEFTGSLAQLGRLLQPEIQTAAQLAGPPLVM